MGKTTRVGKSLIEIQKELGTKEQCVAFLEALRWPDGVRCPKCGGERISKYQTAEGKRTRISTKTGLEEIKVVPSRYLYQCLDRECWFQFSVTDGTIFNDSHLPLEKWMLAVAIMCNAKKGVSAKQLQRDLACSYKTAWYLSHRIREAMMLGNWTDEKMSGTVEADETYIGGKYDKRRKRAKYDKPAVFGMIERETGRVYATQIDAPNQWQVGQHIDAAVSPDARFVTDESRLYMNLERRGFEHEIVIHSDKEWVRGDVHTQSIDGFWSLLKRGVVGSFHQISIKHLNRYIQEFSYRFNGSENQEMFAITVACLALGKPLPYAKLAGDNPIVHYKKGINQFTQPGVASPSADPSDEPF
ncbi:MAG: IS1595 family transposase [Bryobacteraceae bacterium]|jgi:transposase-like protein